ncbi:hypothetical protein LWX53_06660 [bacterium]|nr:hypothetical protein [bacterium]
MMDLDSAASQKLLATVPAIARARGRRLYAADGRRIVDLYADGGASVMGRREGASGRVAKESIDRGLASPLPGFWEERLRKALLAWLPGWAGVRFFASETEALFSLAGKDEAFERDLAGGMGLAAALASFRARLTVELPYRAFRTDLPGAAEAGAALGGRFALARLPAAPAFAVGAALAKTPEDLEALSGFGGAPAAALQLAASARSLADFLAFAPSFDEAKWSRMDAYLGSVFKRSGPWLYPAYPESEHARIFAACLEAGILISPDWRAPSIVPPDFDKGELAPLGSIAV